MTLAVIRNGLADNSNCGVGVVTSRTRNGFACTSVTADEPRERGNRLVPNLWIAIKRQNLDEISYHVGNADIFVTARLAGETVKSTFADRRYRIVQSEAKRVRRNVACVMIQQEQAGPTHPHIRVTQGGDLNSGDWNLFAQPRPAFLRKRCPSMDKITRDFEIRSRHHTQSALLPPERVKGSRCSHLRRCGYMSLLQWRQLAQFCRHRHRGRDSRYRGDKLPSAAMEHQGESGRLVRRCS